MGFLMKLYAVKCGADYLRKRDDGIELVSVNKASVFASAEDAICLRDAYRGGKIAELVLSEILLDV